MLELLADSKTCCVPKIGAMTKDKDGNVGIVIANDDHHNIEVDFNNGNGLYCIVKGCHEYEELFIL